MDGPRNYHTKWSKSYKDKYHTVSFIYGILRKWNIWTYLQDRRRLTDIENNFMATIKERGRGINLRGVWD